MTTSNKIGRPMKFSLTEVKMIHAEYERGVSANDLAKKYTTSNNLIYKVLKFEGPYAIYRHIDLTDINPEIDDFPTQTTA